jgi:hypothetical protein
VAAAQVPVPVAERLTTRRGLSVRVTLFSNRVVVLSARQDEEKIYLRQTTLEEGDYLVYLGALERDAGELGEEPVSSDVATSEAEVTLVLHVGPDPPRLVRFSPMAALELPLSRIMVVMDDLHQQVLESSPAEESVRNWNPRKGDRVQLLTGAYAVVREVWEEGLVVLQEEATYVRHMVLPDQREEVVLRVVETAR